jgi:hypothetical protein
LRDEGLITVGIGATLTGAFLFLFTLGLLQWSELLVYWPVFPLIVGFSFFALYLRGGMRDSGLLVPAFAIGGAGVIALPFTLGAVENEFVLQAVRFWPLLLPVLGLAFLFRPARRKRPKRERKVGQPRPKKPGRDTAE